MQRRENPDHYRFLTFSTFDRVQVFRRSAVKDAFALHLKHVAETIPFQLTAWVIMPEHIHLLLRANDPDYPVPRILQSLKQPFAQRALARFRELDAPVLTHLTDKQGHTHFWQRGGGYDRNIWSAREYDEKRLYTHNNPVKRRLVERYLEYPWSSARWYHPKHECAFGIPITPAQGPWDS